MSTMYGSLGLGTRPAPSAGDLSWSERWIDARCTQSDPELWYAESAIDRRKAIEMCRECPLIAQCAEAGAGERYGIWGGVDKAASDRAKQARWNRAREDRLRAERETGAS